MNKLAHRYFVQGNFMSDLISEYYESCFDDSGNPLNPDEPSSARAAAADKLFDFVKDIYSEALQCTVEVEIKEDKK